jgi:uncharacterized protein YukE
MSMIGGNPEELSALKAEFDRQSDVVRQLTASIRTRLGVTTWTGPNADSFRSSWTDEYEPVLGRLAQALSDAGVAVAQARDRLLQAGGA